jgi:hypothetical protein
MKQYRVPVVFIIATVAALLGLSGAGAETAATPASGTKVSEVGFSGLLWCGGAKEVQSGRLDFAFVLV